MTSEAEESMQLTLNKDAMGVERDLWVLWFRVAA